MLGNLEYITVRLPLPPKRWWAVVLAVALGAICWQGFVVLAVLVWALVPVALAVGDKFELDLARRRYRAGLHWANILNPGWQPLPGVEKIVVKPYRYRAVQPTRYNGTVDEGSRHAFTVLLSLSQARLGTVVATVPSETEATKIAAMLADALQVPWQQA
ncbi:hypothetical protein ACFST9_19485 [Hymenobacter monticola]|uniref:Uncharacterized protein n=1 Tax=Hymenobacter monticola TaxID=1705399 RepID=A0ABY4AYD8_9BACT|nr:hypothetical protein [Hymenobacter monticola]UOE31913.1 hypothetical protein MTP16_12280 [Hymenobacter monticola]